MRVLAIAFLLLHSSLLMAADEVIGFVKTVTGAAGGVPEADGAQGEGESQEQRRLRYCFCAESIEWRSGKRCCRLQISDLYPEGEEIAHAGSGGGHEGTSEYESGDE